MLHYSSAKKNKHQHDETLLDGYLYEQHRSSKKQLKRLSNETRAELNDDIYYMRRHFKNTVRKLRRNLYYTNWLKNMSEVDIEDERIRLRPRHA